MGEGCPGAGCGTEGPGTAAAGGCAAAGGAGEGRPLGAGTGSFCGVLGPPKSGPGPVGQERCEQLGRVTDLRPYQACPLSPWSPGMVTRKYRKGRKKEGRKMKKGGRCGEERRGQRKKNLGQRKTAFTNEQSWKWPPNDSSIAN